MKISSYETFTSEDFLEDKFFIEWVKYKKPESEKFWADWTSSNPTNLRAMKDAEKQLSILLSVKRIEANNSEQELVWNRILESVDKVEGKVNPINSGLRRWVIAASVAAILIIAGSIWLVDDNKETQVEFRTPYGQMKKIVLPDQSEVTLNANSDVRFRKKWNNSGAREIWLNGEAFFNVKHLNKKGTPIKEDEKFIIHTELVEVEVLGTVFNVKERHQKVEVSLESGSVKVKLNNEKNKQWFLKPGEVAMYNNSLKEIEKITDNPLIHKAWTEQKMLTNNTTVREIVQALEDQYGVKVVLQDKGLADRRIDGTLPLKSESNALFVLSNILNIDIENKDSVLIFKTRK